MTTRIYTVTFGNNFHKADIVARSIYQAVKMAMKMWKDELFSRKTTGDSRYNTPRKLWRYYKNNGYTTVTSVELGMESDN